MAGRSWPWGGRRERGRTFGDVNHSAGKRSLTGALEPPSLPAGSLRSRSLSARPRPDPPDMEQDIPEDTLTVRGNLRVLLSGLAFFEGLDGPDHGRHRRRMRMAVPARWFDAVRGWRTLRFHVPAAVGLPRLLYAAAGRRPAALPRPGHRRRERSARWASCPDARAWPPWSRCATARSCACRASRSIASSACIRKRCCASRS